MEDVIKLHSRGENNNFLKLMKKPDDSKSKTYILKTDSPTLRVGNTSTNKMFIDPSGGPMIVVGSELKEAKAIVKSIDFIVGYGYTITFE